MKSALSSSGFIGRGNNRMRKYREIARTYLKTQLVWRADVLFNMVFTVGRILFAYLLWKVIFAEKDMIGGFTFHGMLSYYIISSFFTQLEMSHGISEEMSARIRNGTFSKYIVIPVNVEGYFAAMESGVVLFYLFFDFAAAFIWIFLFGIEFALVKDGMIIACALIMVLLGMFFMVQLNFFLGILTFKYEEINTFLMIKNNLIALVTGSIVPLVLFPDTIVSFMRFLPFYYVTYLPSMLLTGKCTDETVHGLIVISCWCIVMQAAIRIAWKRYVRRFDGVGI